MRAATADVSESSFPIDRPLYRVNFWQRPGPEYGWNLDAWHLYDSRDVQEAIQWAEEHRDGRIYEVFVTNDDSEETEFAIRLLGSNPHSHVSA